MNQHRSAGTGDTLSLDWQTQGVCREEDPELFWPIGNSGPALEQLAEAVAVCRVCPVMQECRDWSLATDQRHGVWGGLGEDERRALKRRNARTRARTA